MLNSNCFSSFLTGLRRRTDLSANLRGFYLACRSILRIWTICFRDFLESRSIFSFPLEKVLAWDFWVYWSVILSRIDVLYSKQTVLSDTEQGFFVCFFLFVFCFSYIFTALHWFQQVNVYPGSRKWKNTKMNDMIFIWLFGMLILLCMNFIILAQLEFLLDL